MRMWMIEPRLLCNKHLTGGHVEMHMFLGTLKRGISVQGYLDNNLMEPARLWDRHEALAEEMTRRGMNHKSPMEREDVIRFREYLTPEQMVTTVDVESSRANLLGRCPDCRALHQEG